MSKEELCRERGEREREYIYLGAVCVCVCVCVFGLHFLMKPGKECVCGCGCKVCMSVCSVCERVMHKVNMIYERGNSGG